MYAYSSILGVNVINGQWVASVGVLHDGAEETKLIAYADMPDATSIELDARALVARLNEIEARPADVKRVLPVRDFLLRFTPGEHFAIEREKLVNEDVAYAVSIAMAGPDINLDSQVVARYLGMLEAIGLLGAGRPAEIVS